MDARKLAELIKQGEGQEVEFSVSAEKEVGRTVCAFANTEGGNIVIGIDDKGGIIGILHSSLDDAQKRLSQSIQICNPTPIYSMKAIAFEGKDLIIITVTKMGDNNICYYHDEIYVRIGSTSQKIKGPAIAEFLRSRQILSFEETRSTATIGDIDLAAIRSFVIKRNPSLHLNDDELIKTLVTWRVAASDKAFHLKNSGVLLFAKEPTQFIPQSSVKLVRFKGTTPVELKELIEIRRNIVDNIKESLAFIQRHTVKGIKIEKLEREEEYEYPIRAIREALVNAMVHRDYFSNTVTQVNVFDDRIEIVNPGALPKGITVKMLPTLGIGYPRNPALYRLLSDIDLIEGVGTGIARMISSMRDAGLPDPVFEDFGNIFKVTLRNSFFVSAVAKELNRRQQKLLRYLQENKTIVSKKYADINDVSIPTAVDDLNKMIKMGLVKRHGKKKGSFYSLK